MKWTLTESDQPLPEHVLKLCHLVGILKRRPSLGVLGSIPEGLKRTGRYDQAEVLSFPPFHCNVTSLFWCDRYILTQLQDCIISHQGRSKTSTGYFSVKIFVLPEIWKLVVLYTLPWKARYTVGPAPYSLFGRISLVLCLIVAIIRLTSNWLRKLDHHF